MEAPYLCIDIGNSVIKAGYFSSEGLLLQVKTLESPAELPEAPVQIAFIDTRLDRRWREALYARNATELSMEKGVPFRSVYSPQLGPDRAAQLVALWEMKAFPAIVISLGTACTVDYIDAQGVHQGGIITPGINLRLKALAEKTGRLPLVSPVSQPALLGKNTIEAIQIGVSRGFQAELIAHIETLRREFGPFRIWITGGETEIIRSTMPPDTIFAPDLTLRGVWLWQRYWRLSGGK
ncbi:MAG: type III pantothenate kinase [Bacteroidia bacterium]